MLKGSTNLVCFFGRQGYGKTDEALDRLFSNNLKSLKIIVDPVANLDTKTIKDIYKFPSSQFVICRNFREIQDFFLNLKQVKKHLLFKLDTVVNHKEIAKCLDLIRRACKCIDNVDLLIDEIDYFNKKEYRYILEEFANRSRHSNFVNLFLIVRKPSTMPICLRSNALKYICFTLAETRDLEFLKDISKEIAEKVRCLKRFEFLEIDR